MRFQDQFGSIMLSFVVNQDVTRWFICASGYVVGAGFVGTGGLYIGVRGFAGADFFWVVGLIRAVGHVQSSSAAAAGYGIELLLECSPSKESSSPPSFSGGS